MPEPLDDLEWPWGLTFEGDVDVGRGHDGWDNRARPRRTACRPPVSGLSGSSP